MIGKEEFWEDLKSGKFVSMVKESSVGRQLSNSEEVYHIMKPLFSRHPDIESLYGIFMDAKNHIIAIEKLFSGSITGSAIYPREIIKRLLTLQATALVLSHNHPSGHPQPSPEDLSITFKVGLSLSSIDAALHDHIIVGSGYYSMADSGFLQAVQRRFAELTTQELSQWKEEG